MKDTTQVGEKVLSSYGRLSVQKRYSGAIPKNILYCNHCVKIDGILYFSSQCSSLLVKIWNLAMIGSRASHQNRKLSEFTYKLAN